MPRRGCVFLLRGSHGAAILELAEQWPQKQLLNSCGQTGNPSCLWALGSRSQGLLGTMQWKWLGLRALGLAAAAGACNCAYTAHYYRPIPHFPGDDYTPSKRRLLDVGNEPPALLVARQVTLMVGKLVSQGIMGAMNSLVIVDDDRYQAWLKAVRERPRGVPLITVANHESCKISQKYYIQ